MLAVYCTWGRQRENKSVDADVHRRFACQFLIWHFASFVTQLSPYSLIHLLCVLTSDAPKHHVFVYSSAPVVLNSGRKSGCSFGRELRRNRAVLCVCGEV